MSHSYSRFTLVQETPVRSYTRGLRIEASIPSLYPGQNQRADHFDQAAYALVAREIEEMAGGLMEVPPEGGPQPDRATGSYIEVSYEVIAATARVVSLLFTVRTYGAGAAHPNSHTRVLNYDLLGGEVLELASLFHDDSGYLQVISDHCIAALQSREIFTSPEGAAPTPENYKSWNLAPSGLVITFDPYQVASYAAGPQEVLVPYEVIRHALLPEGPVDSFLRDG